MAIKTKKSLAEGPYTLTNDVFGSKILFVNYYMVGKPGTNEWYLIDAGLPGSSGRILKEAEELYGKTTPKAIILTHGHFDHVGALPDLLRAWPDTQVYAHPLELPYLTGKSSYPPPDPLAGNGGMAYMSWAYPIRPINLGTRVSPLPVDGSIPFMPEWRYILTPGHSPGHISLFRDRDRVLIAGDAFTTTNQNSLSSVLMQSKEIHGPPAYFTINWQESYSSIKSLAELNPEIAGTGHGLPVRGELLKEGLDELIHNFISREIPLKGRYAGNPAFANENGVQAMPAPTSFRVARFIAGLSGALAVAGIAYFANKRISKK